MNKPLNTSWAKLPHHWRFNPLRTLGPEALSRHLDDFRVGRLRGAVNIFDLLEERDDLLRGVISKRKKAVARHGWTVIPLPNLSPAEQAEAREHVAALEYFYQHLECENALDTAERGGFKLLARQMMDAVGKRFAVHELVWRRDERAGAANRAFITAKFRFVPLAFFENTTGELRYLPHENATEGIALEPGAWMVTVGEGLLIASATAWMFKHLALNDWLRASQRNGAPALIGITNSLPNSEHWNALDRALESLVQGRAVIHSEADSIKVLNLLGGGQLPYPQLIERVDRLLASLWRGADLSTLSRDRGYGASLQEKETCSLEEDDAEMIAETLNRYVDEWVIRQVFGDRARPLARLKVLVSPRECTANDLRVDEFLLRHGAPLSLEATLNRYGRALPKPGEQVLLGAPARRNASLPASSQNHRADHMGNQEAAAVQDSPCLGPDVSSRGCSPAQTDGAAENSAALSNQFILLQEEWVQLSPFGDFPHARGLQRLDRSAAEALVARFQSFLGRAGRLFGGVPFYVGHPDLPNASELADRKAYGWVEELQAREDGLYGRVKWSQAGLDLLRNGHYKFLSPFWEAREVTVESGRKVFQPTVLLSVGLTNQPNIPVKPLANQAAPYPDTAPAPLPLANTRSRVGNLGPRRAELTLLQNSSARIQEQVRARMRDGLSYDQAWDQVKAAEGEWFRAEG
jgi:hypothetical protein